MTVAECAKLLGEAIKNDEAALGFNAAKEAYEASEEIQNAIREYSAQRMLLGQEQMKDTAMQDGELMQKLQARIDELYTFVMESPLYKNLMEAQEKLNNLMQSVNSDIQFYAFGERPCTHDCSSCGADCASRG
ncbi:MAG: YlbF family regulator [Clostridia bacterium]|nr:YlbF family regulator [Clostridia bacterium]